MIDHVELSVGDLARSSRFFAGALAPIGYTQRTSGTSNGFGTDEGLDFFVRAGGPSAPLPHLAFRCESRALVDAAFGAAMAAGGIEHCTPQLLARVHPSYYAAMVKDPDGHVIEFACHREES